VPIGLEVGPANRYDGKLVRETLKSIPVRRPRPTPRRPQHLYQDKGYDFEPVRALDRAWGYTAHIQARVKKARAIQQDVGFKTRRWVVERTTSWMNRFRRILIRWEKKAENYIGLLHLVCAIIAYRSAEVFV
jgi:transposase